MQSAHDPAALAALAWQLELGADEAIGEAPVDRFAASRPPGEPRTGQPAPAAPGASPPPPNPTPAAPPPAAPPRTPPPRTALPLRPGPPDPPASDMPGGAAPGDAAAAAAAARTLEELAAAMQALDAGALKAGAQNFVFADGRPGARLMVVGEAPGQEEDRMGRPFVGRAGRLLDRMLAGIGLARDAADPARAVYITNVLPWRPPGNRTPTEAEAALFLPFLERHIALARPEALLILGNTPLRALLGEATGITKARGRWRTHGATGTPAMPSFHPAYLLRQPAQKKQAWADLLEIAALLDGDGTPRPLPPGAPGG